MVWQRSRWVLGLVLVGGMRGQVPAPPPPPVLGALAQQQQPTGPVGSVTGRVLAQDTGRAVRFAQVMLQSVASANSGGGGRGGIGGGFGASFTGGGGSVATLTDVEGNFTVTGVSPGDYYVTANAPGYLSELTLLQTQAAAGADPAALVAGLPMVRVAADSTSSVAVTIERGGTISGRVVWEDGSVASGVSVMAVPTVPLPAMPTALQGLRLAGGSSNFGMTDDRGAFRISGLMSGDYLLRAQMQAPFQQGGVGRPLLFNTMLVVYLPGVFRKSQAKAVSVRTGDERSDVRMVIDLRGLHTVTGHVSSTNAGQTVAAGLVMLRDPNNADQQLMGSVDEHGDFTVRYVPEGSYNLVVNGASTVAGQLLRRGRGGNNGGSSGVSFQPFTQPLTMPDSDLSGVVVMLTPTGGG